MSSLSYDLSGRDPLPPADGPKLQPFEHREAIIEVLKLLSEPEQDTSESMGHAHVFEVLIAGKSYALKVFKFFDIPWARRNIFPFFNSGVADSTMVFHSDPFFAECRAYGKIADIERQRQKRAGRDWNTGRKKKSQNVAVKCFGFLALPADPYEDLFRREFGVTEWGRPRLQREEAVSKREPFRAIVKELRRAGPSVVNPYKMVRDLECMRKEGIYQGDVFARKYMGGLLVDFSMALTSPHWVFDVVSKSQLSLALRQDLEDFDAMIEDEGVETKVRAIERDSKKKK